MNHDEELNLKSAFAELHRRQRRQAPPFDTMRKRVLSEAEGARTCALRWPVAIACGTATVGVMIGTVWWRDRSPEPPSTAIGEVESPSRLDQLIVSIEEHVEFNAAISSPEYPTDLLLPGNQFIESP